MSGLDSTNGNISLPLFCKSWSLDEPEMFGWGYGSVEEGKKKKALRLTSCELTLKGHTVVSVILHCRRRDEVEDDT